MKSMALVLSLLVGTMRRRSGGRLRGIRRTTGCNMVAIERDGELHPNPAPSAPLTEGAHVILIGDAERARRGSPSAIPLGLHPPRRRAQGRVRDAA